ncbi:SAM-dependent methyltransferase [Nonomuraea ferruginea]
MITVVGWDGSGLSAKAADRLKAARLVIGPDHLTRRLAPSAATAHPGGLLDALDAHMERGEGPAVVIAEGDPGFFGVVRTLRGHGLEPDVLPATSIVTRAFACAGLDWDDALVVAPAQPPPARPRGQRLPGAPQGRAARHPRRRPRRDRQGARPPPPRARSSSARTSAGPTSASPTAAWARPPPGRGRTRTWCS